jgi:predicted DNA-binding transcriptional regulator YafY
LQICGNIPIFAVDYDIRPTIDFVSELLSKIDGLDVLQPESLRERIRQILEGALRRNP